MTEAGDLEAKLGYRFRRPELLEQALTHGSVRHEQQTGDHPDPSPAQGDNERMEFLGDAIVGMVIAELLYQRYPELDEGELTRLRAALVSRRHLGLVGTILELGSYLRLGRAEERNGGRHKAVLLANCMEALIAGIYLEGGLGAAAAFVERIVALPYLDTLRNELREHHAIGDYKTALQELLQSRRAGQPTYVVQAESGPDHRKRFLVEARIGRADHDSGAPEYRAKGEGTTKKKAEQEAAMDLYVQLTRGTKRDEHPLAAKSESPAPAQGRHLTSARASLGPLEAPRQQADAMPSRLSAADRSAPPETPSPRPRNASSKRKRPAAAAKSPTIAVSPFPTASSGQPPKNRSTTRRSAISIAPASAALQPDATPAQTKRS